MPEKKYARARIVRLVKTSHAVFSGPFLHFSAWAKLIFSAFSVPPPKSRKKSDFFSNPRSGFSSRTVPFTPSVDAKQAGMDGGEANFGQGERLIYRYVGTSTFLRGCTMGYERRVLLATYEKLALP